MMAVQKCAWVVRTVKPLKSRPATAFSFRQVSRITTSARARTLVLWELTPTDGNGICFEVSLANDQNPIAPSQLCQSPITIRSTAPMARCGNSGNPRFNTAIMAVSSCARRTAGWETCTTTDQARCLSYVRDGSYVRSGVAYLHELTATQIRNGKILFAARIRLLLASKSVGHRNGDLSRTAWIQSARHDFRGICLFAWQTRWRRSP